MQELTLMKGAQATDYTVDSCVFLHINFMAIQIKKSIFATPLLISRKEEKHNALFDNISPTSEETIIQSLVCFRFIKHLRFLVRYKYDALLFNWPENSKQTNQQQSTNTHNPVQIWWRLLIQHYEPYEPFAFSAQQLF